MHASARAARFASPLGSLAALLLLALPGHGEAARFTSHLKAADDRLPASLLGEAGDWVSLMGEKLDPDRADHWGREGGGLVGRATTADWDACRLGSERFEVVR